MKKLIVFLFVIVTCAMMFYSCSKSGGEPHPEQPKLLFLKSNNGTDSNQYSYHYDASGRVVRLTQATSAHPDSLFAAISYGGGQIKIIKYVPRPAGLIAGDTTLLFTIGDSMVTKRIYHAYYTYNFGAPTYDYRYDTTSFQYNANGILTSLVTSSYDSTGGNPATTTISVVRTTRTITYTMLGGNLVHSSEIENINQVNRSNGYTSTDNRSTDGERDYDYASAFPNKTDFSNQIVMNELFGFLIPMMNDRLANLANKETLAYTVKDENGNVTFNSTASSDYSYTYDAQGWVQSVSSGGGSPLTCVYGTPGP